MFNLLNLPLGCRRRCGPGGNGIAAQSQPRSLLVLCPVSAAHRIHARGINEALLHGSLLPKHHCYAQSHAQILQKLYVQIPTQCPKCSIDLVFSHELFLHFQLTMSLAAARPLISVYTEKSEPGGVTVCLPAVFRFVNLSWKKVKMNSNRSISIVPSKLHALSLRAPVRPDIVSMIHNEVAKNRRQPYCVSEPAGHQVDTKCASSSCG